MDQLSLQERASEEMLLVQSEMINTYEFYQEQHAVFLCKYNDMKSKSNGSRWENGAISLITQKLLSIEQTMCNLFSLFSPLVTEMVTPPRNITDSESYDISFLQDDNSSENSESDVSDISEIE